MLKVGREFTRYRLWEAGNDYEEFKLYTRKSYGEEWDENPIGSIRLSNSWRQRRRDEEMHFAVVGNIAAAGITVGGNISAGKITTTDDVGVGGDLAVVGDISGAAITVTGSIYSAKLRRLICKRN